MESAPAYVLDFTDRSVLVVGAGSGIGAGIARAFAAAGANLALSSLSGEMGALEVQRMLMAAGRRCLTQEVDCRYIDQIEHFVGKAIMALGGLDILVYNAGITDPQPLLDITEDQWDQTMDVNLKGMFFCARRVAAHMQAAGRSGTIVLLSSVHSLQAAPGHGHYAASKAGVSMLTRSLALELAPRGIRVNAIAPGVVYVERHRLERLYDPAEMAKSIPIGRVGTPEDIADLALFLASERAAYITGQVVVADGGLTLPLGLPKPA